MDVTQSDLPSLQVLALMLSPIGNIEQTPAAGARLLRRQQHQQLQEQHAVTQTGAVPAQNTLPPPDHDANAGAPPTNTHPNTATAVEQQQQQQVRHEDGDAAFEVGSFAALAGYGSDSSDDTWGDEDDLDLTGMGFTPLHCSTTSAMSPVQVSVVLECGCTSISIDFRLSRS